MRSFKLEEYLTKHEFSAPYLLCCSDAESFSMQEIIDLASPEDKKMWDDLALSYTEPLGLPQLRKQISTTLYPSLEPKNILCTAGAEEGIFATLFALCESKDHVIVLTPCYQSLLEVPKLKGAEVSTIELKEENDWRIDIASIKNAIKPNTKFIIINFPHNPTGQVITQTELDELIALCRMNDIWLFSDEVYRLLGNPDEDWAKPVAETYEKGISISVMSKAFGMAGLRIGWIACQDTAMLHKIKQMKDYLSICNSAPSEIISLIALKNIDQILARNNKIVTENLALLDLFFQEFSDQFSWVRPQGGCIGFVKYLGSESIDIFSQKLLEDKGVLLMPASIYDQPTSHFRIGFGRKNMAIALEKLKEFIRK